MSAIAIAVILLGVLGAGFGLVLAVASKKLTVEADPRVGAILEALPGANCGGCGYPGCAAMAEAIASGVAPVNGCPVGKSACAAKIAAIMGVEIDVSAKPKFPQVFCQGGKAQRTDRFYYFGVRDCAAAQMLNGGYKVCESGCLGLGSCVQACKFDALRINDNELPEVDPAKCTGCGACAQACPRHLIQLVDEDSRVRVLCQNHGRGPEVKKACQVGCIGCGICARNCPEKAITLTDNLPVIDPAKCTACGLCVQKCPMKTIKMARTETGQETAEARLS
ncbi:MAG: RnfABCDGE type electron transport complex subunit B [Bacillota bacterium]|jgi:Na+-translocating ferredoxin:NAD+ oxidoreductase RNF subunit RnfB